MLSKLERPKNPALTTNMDLIPITEAWLHAQFTLDQMAFVSYNFFMSIRAG